MGRDHDILANFARCLIDNNDGTFTLRTSVGNVTIGTTTLTSGTDKQILYDNNGVVGEAARLINALGRITNRVISMADGTTITPTSDTADMNTHINTQSAGTLTVAAPSGTPIDGQVLIVRIKSTNVQTFAWNSIYRGSTTVALPTSSTGSSKTDYLYFQYNSADSKWDLTEADYGY